MNMSVLDNFESWKDFLGDRLHQAQSQGISEHAISDLAYDIGDYLSNHVDAKNPEEAVVKQLWNVADTKEQHAIANMMVKLVESEGTDR